MDLLTLNNQIVALRPLVRRSKVHVVRKLIRTVRKLKEKRGTDEQKLKNQHKADRIRLEISEIKKINVDDVAKYAIEKTNVNETMKENSIIRKLASFKPIEQQIQNYREKFPNWETELATLLKMKEVRKKYNIKNKSTVKKKANVRKKTVKSQSHETSRNVEHPLKMKSLTPLTTTKEKLEVSTNNAIKTSLVPVPVKEKIEGEIEIKKLDLNNLNICAEEVSSTNIKKNAVEAKSITHVPCMKDNFFLTSDNSGEDTANDESDKDSVHSSPLQENSFNYKNKKSRYSTEIPKTSHLRSHHEKQPREKFSYQKRHEFNAKPFSRKVQNNSEDSSLQVKGAGNESLHPSWQAKRQLKNQSTIHEFKGKKILFDDD